tara:strand:- start:1364 stop:1477 length:114 start_codon:yes stop_codon:yes gene_type:complete
MDFHPQGKVAWSILARHQKGNFPGRPNEMFLHSHSTR